MNKNNTVDTKVREDELAGESFETKEEDMPDDAPDDEPAHDEKSSFGNMSKMGIFALLLLGVVLPLSSLIGVNAQSQPVENLIANPNLETEVSAPAVWNRGGYGENTVSFSYPTTGGAGESHAVRIDMTEHLTGDAKWYPDDVPVKPSTKYIFSDSSFSNVSTPIDIRYKVINRPLERLGVGSKYRYRYVKLGDVPAQSTATVRQFEFTTPPNAVSLTIFHAIDRVGYLTTDNYSLTEAGGTTGTTTTPIDASAPLISITAPLNNGSVSGTTTVSVNATDNVGVVGVRVVHSGTNHSDIPIGTEDTVAPYSFDWSTVGVADGVHMLIASARDAAGNIATSSTISVTVNNAIASSTDTVAPTVSVTSPITGTTIYATTTVSMNAADNVGVAGVSFLLDGAMVMTEDIVSPYSFDWNTVNATNGNHTIAGQARDAAGNIATSSAVLINVSNN